MPNLQVAQPVSSTAQPIADETGTRTPIHVSATSVGIRTGSPETALDVAGDIKAEYNGSPKLILYSRGDGVQKYSMRVTNDADHAGGRLLVIRNETAGRDDVTLDERGNLKLEHNGSPSLILFSRGNGTHQYSIRATNDGDHLGGRRFAIRNDTQGEDVLVIDADHHIHVAGDIMLSGADCAEHFTVIDAGVEAGTVMVIDEGNRLRQSTQPYDPRVAGVVSGAGARKPGLVLGADGGETVKVPLALTGSVFCLADATPAPIEVGDLLTSASSPGHAMKAVDRNRAFGAVIGKALQSLPTGRGLIPILVSLQ